MKPRRVSAGQQELAREHVRLELAPLPRAVILDALQTHRGRLCRSRWVDVALPASRRARMDLDVPDLVRHEESSRADFAGHLAADRAALLIE